MKDQFANQAEAFAAGHAEGLAEAAMQAAQVNREKERAGWALLEELRDQMGRISDDLEIGLDAILVWSATRDRSVF